MDMEDSQYYVKYDRLESTYWWHLARKRVLGGLLRKYIRERPGRILDIGCGPGSNLASWKDLGETAGMDFSEEAVRFAVKRLGARVAVGSASSLPFKSGTCKVVSALDVIEHLDDPGGCIAEASRVCVTGGLVIVTVPAYQFMYNPHTDAAQGHRRRYDRKGLRRLVAGHGLKIIRLSYFNTILFPMMLLQRLIVKRTRNEGKDALDIICPPLPKALNRALEMIFASELHLLRLFDLPFGGSVLCICEKT